MDAHAVQPTSAISSRVECQGPLLGTGPFAFLVVWLLLFFRKGTHRTRVARLCSHLVAIFPSNIFFLCPRSGVLFWFLGSHLLSHPLPVPLEPPSATLRLSLIFTDPPLSRTDGNGFIKAYCLPGPTHHFASHTIVP